MDSQQPQSLAWLLPTVLRILPEPPCSIFDIGCGNGSMAKELIEHGYAVKGIDISAESVAVAKQYGEFECKSVYEELDDNFDRAFDVVLSLEVVEHLMRPRELAGKAARLLRPNGIVIVSTPYHSYLKNVAISVTGRWDRHHDPLWDGGHVKFWSRRTLAILFSEVGLNEAGFHRVGRFPLLAKSMIGVYRSSDGPA